jgi:hypoxanthine phosphoribosyltransferase
MEADIERTLIPRERIAKRVAEMADEIAHTYEHIGDEGLVLVTILSGSIVFLADLIRRLPFKMKIGLVTVSSYPGASMVSRGPKLRQQLNLDIRGRHVLVVDDILDTGRTLEFVQDELKGRDPASLRTCVLLRKTDKAPQHVSADFVGFDIEDVFVVGYGLDFDDHYRNWPDIGVLRAEIYRARRDVGDAD